MLARAGYEEADPLQALEETRAYAAAVATFARDARATFVSTWTLPPWHRGYGPLDFRPGLGIANLLARMNVALADALRDAPNVFVLDAARWLTSLGPRAWSDKLWYAAKSPFTAAAFEQAASDIGAAVAGLNGGARRIVILDLDDVWGGTVGEMGWQGLNLGGHDHIGEAHVDFQRAPRLRTLDDIARARGVIALPDARSVRRAFPHAARRLGADAVAAFAAISRLVGMECPGLYVLYPSTTASDLEPARELTEYAAAKAAGEALCHSLTHTVPGLRIVVSRLPRVATDQTVTILPIRSHDPVTVLLPIVRELQRASNGTGR